LIHLNKKRFITLSLIIIFLILAYIPNYLLPMMSDDFWYGEKNINLISASIQHYLQWSGRLLTDITSRIILRYPAWLLSGIKAIALVGLIWLIALLPNMILNKKIFSRTNLYLMFITYWICNPNLGQTTFWTVGASNYLFTNVWILMYLNLVFYMFYHQSKWYGYVLLGITAFGAGLSNENTGPMVVIFTVGMLIYASHKNKNIISWIYGAIFTALGAAVLLLSPGNSFRAHSLPLKFQTGLTLNKLYSFFTDGTSIKWFSNYGFLFLIFVIVVVLLYFKKNVARKPIFWSLLFFSMAIVANFAFILSPFTMVRSLQGAFVFFLISLSFLVTELMSESKNKIINIIFSIMLICATLLFVTSYVLEINSFKLARAESNIRETLVLQAKRSKKSTVMIPGWYYGTLLRPQNDPYDSYLSEHFGPYYGYKGTIKEVKTPIDYTKTGIFKDNVVKVSGSKVVKGIKFIINSISGETAAIVLLKNVNKNASLDLRIQLKDKEVEDYNLPLINTLKLHGDEFISTALKDQVDKNSLDKVTIIVTNTNGVAESIVLSNHDVHKLL